MLENLRHNLEVNVPSAAARVEHLDWEQVEWTRDRLPDVVLGADIVYDSRVIPSLVVMLKQLLAAGGIAYIVSTIRNGNCIKYSKSEKS